MPPVIPCPQGSTFSADSKVYVICANMPDGYEVVNSGPVLNYGDGGWADWSCPPGIEDVDAAFPPGEGSATVTGELFDGTPIEGSDSICIVP
jgi:hypothetical protein